MMVLKTPGEIELMDQANRIVLKVLDEVGAIIAPGVTPRELDRLAEKVIRGAGAVPAFLNYRGYPATLCISVDDVIVHGIPNDVPLKGGQIVGIDCGVVYKGYFGDAARTFAVGEVGDEARRLLRVTEEALRLAVEQVRPGARLSDIGYAVQLHAEKHGFSVVRDLAARGPAGAELWQAGQGAEAPPGSRAGHRADGQCRKGRRPDGCRRLDGADRGWVAVGPFRVLGRGDRVGCPGARPELNRREEVCPKKKTRSRSRRR